MHKFKIIKSFPPESIHEVADIFLNKGKDGSQAVVIGLYIEV